MDPKKQNMAPELKEVYDRVMSTSATPAAATPPPATTPPITPAQPSGSPVMTSVEPTTANTPPLSTPISTPAANPTQPAAPAPTASSGSFVFNGNKVVGGATPKAAGTAAKKNIPPFLIPVGVVVLIIAWSALWAKIFGLF